MFLRRLKNVTKKTYFLRCTWDALKTSQKSRLFWDFSERSLRCLTQCRSDWDLSETFHAGWIVCIGFLCKKIRWERFSWHILLEVISYVVKQDFKFLTVLLLARLFPQIWKKHNVYVVKCATVWHSPTDICECCSVRERLSLWFSNK